jgi:hypothetical protein
MTGIGRVECCLNAQFYTAVAHSSHPDGGGHRPPRTTCPEAEGAVVRLCLVLLTSIACLTPTKPLSHAAPASVWRRGSDERWCGGYETDGPIGGQSMRRYLGTVSGRRGHRTQPRACARLNTQRYGRMTGVGCRWMRWVLDLNARFYTYCRSNFLPMPDELLVAFFVALFAPDVLDTDVAVCQAVFGSSFTPLVVRFDPRKARPPRSPSEREEAQQRREAARQLRDRRARRRAERASTSGHHL